MQLGLCRISASSGATPPRLALSGNVIVYGVVMSGTVLAIDYLACSRDQLIKDLKRQGKPVERAWVESVLVDQRLPPDFQDVLTKGVGAQLAITYIS